MERERARMEGPDEFRRVCAVTQGIGGAKVGKYVILRHQVKWSGNQVNFHFGRSTSQSAVRRRVASEGPLIRV